jgi:hypothetical protein
MLGKVMLMRRMLFTFQLLCEGTPLGDVVNETDDIGKLAKAGRARYEQVASNGKVCGRVPREKSGERLHRRVTIKTQNSFECGVERRQ